LQKAQGDASDESGETMHSTAAAGRDTTSSNEPVWFLPSGAAQGERNAHRARGWLIVVGASIVLWAAVAVAVVAIVSAIN
jgi:hypothetical protein